MLHGRNPYTFCCSEDSSSGAIKQSVPAEMILSAIIREASNAVKFKKENVLEFQEILFLFFSWTDRSYY